ncbi:hypothetical protein CQ14_07055 [Bradyrhizobium lablabi]|uniref:DUF1902 domain-containing protein n=1 Tax=Bradyrhizobium lablabi TaxID=722472 RepID=A0A0R3MMM1_9BRAD|nr:hypothetical protein [Bradyrhizobium lablabi]KRR21399.1 hypothetical protein CQ14_07055 [Bradyrhizobium lablabi]
MNTDVQIITVEVRRSNSGLYTATSDALDGVYMAHTDREAIVADLPAVVSRWFKSNHNIDVDVFMRPPVPNNGGFYIPTIPVPAEIAARSLGR